jgi:hypothetical protein
MFCTSCGKNLGGKQAKFCDNCGTAVSASAKNEKVRVAASGSTIESPKGPRKTPKWLGELRSKLKSIPVRVKVLSLSSVAAIAATFTILAFVPGAFAPLTAGQIPKFDEVVSADVQSEVAKGLCSGLRASLPDESQLAEFDSRIDQINAVGGDARNMLAFSNTTSWMVGSDEPGAISRTVDSNAIAGLKKILDNPPIWGIDDSNREMIAKAWLSDFTEVLLDECGLADDVNSIKAEVSEYQRVLNEAIRVAESAPWYPRGFFTVYGDDDELAFKWTDKPSDCYSCYEWTAIVVSRDGCSSTYVEGNIETSGGSLVDWSNDTTGSLRPGQRANLAFQSYVDGYGTLTFLITEFSCN